MKKIIFCVTFLIVTTAAAFAEKYDEKSGPATKAVDMLKWPFQSVLKPFEVGGLVDLIFKPVEVVTDHLFDLGDMAVTPGRTKEYVFNVNKNVSIVNEKDIELLHPKDVQDAVFYVPGVMVNGYLGNAKDSNVSMRGFGENGSLNYVVLIDGRRINQIDMSGVDLAQVDMSSVERIEITRGGSSVLYGDNAAGGVMNIITKRGETGDHVEYTQELGSYQYYKEHASAYGGHDFMDYFLSYSYQDSAGYRLNNRYEANDALTSFTIKPCDMADVRVSSSYHKDIYGEPGALYDMDMQRNGRTASRFPYSHTLTEDGYVTVDPRIFGKIADNEIVLSAFFSYRLRRTKTPAVANYNYEVNHHTDSWDFRPKCEVNSFFFGETVENKLVFGADYFTADDRILSGNIDLVKSQVNVSKETFGIYASDNAMINKRFIINWGIRGEWAEYTFDQFQPLPALNDASLRDAAFDAGLGYKYNERSQIYVNCARAYRLPATDEFFQSAYQASWGPFVFVVPASLATNLKQQVGNSYEIGMKDNSFSLFHLNASYYLMDTKNEIYYDPVLFQNQNYHDVIRHGLELETRLDVIRKVYVFLNYTFQKAFFNGGKYAGYTVPLVPENKISGGVNITPFDTEMLKGLNVNFTVDHVSSRFIASDPRHDSSPLKPYTTAAIGLIYEYKNIKVFGRMNNLFDERYFSNATRNWLGFTAFYPAPEREFETGVTVTF